MSSTDQRIPDAGWPKVAVIVVNWNGRQFLEHCLAALMAQTVTPWEIFVVDNASSDDSLSIVRQFSSIRLIALDENAGFAGGNNLALKKVSAEAEWIALLNPDAYPEPRWLQALLESSRRQIDFDIFGSRLINAENPAVLDGIGDVYHVSGLVWRNGHGDFQAEGGEKEREIFSPCAAAAMYRRSAMDAAHGFDEDYFCYVEDVDLGFRMRLAGHRCLYVPDSVVHHVGSGTTGGQHSDFSLYHGHRNLVWTFVKDMPGVLFWVLLPLHVLLNLVTVIWFGLRGRGGVILRAKRDAILGLPKMWNKRNKIQTGRVVSIKEIWRVLNKDVPGRTKRSVS